MSKTIEITQQNTKRKHGLISMLSMIVGVVIGSGIFFKNDAMFSHTNSAIMSMVAWGIISVIVLLMTISFIEIASSTQKPGRTSSYGNWASSFFNDKIGKIINLFFTLIYMPPLFLLLGMVAAEFLGAGLYEAMGKDFYNVSNAQEAWRNYGMIVGCGMAFVFGLFVLNNKTQKGGKILQIGGTGLKLIPLLTIIGIVLVYVISGMSPSGGSNINIGDPIKNPGFEDSKLTLISGLFMALPAAMYSFDGFTHSAVLQSEATNKRTYKTSLTIGMIFIVTIYLASSWAMFSGGIQNQDTGKWDFSISSAITGMLGEGGKWLSTTFTFLIFISVLTGLSGFIILAIRQYSLLSLENTIADINGKLIKRNNQGIPERSGWLMFLTTVFWALYLIPMDAIDVHLATTVGNFKEIYYYGSTEYLVDLATVGAFVVYALLLVGGLSNRRTKRVEVTKVKFFVPAATVASIFTTIIAGYMVYDIFSTFASIFDGDVKAMEVGKIISFTLTIISIFWLYKYFEKKSKLITNKEWKNKENHIKAYNMIMTPNEYKKFVVKNKRKKKT